MHKGVRVFGPMCWSDLSHQKEGKSGSAEGQGEEAMSTGTTVEGVAAEAAAVGTEVAVDTAAAVVAVVVAVLDGESSCSSPGYPGESGEQTEDQMEGRVVLGLMVSASVDQLEAHRGLIVETGWGTEVVVAIVVVVVVVAVAVVVEVK
jgi:hypothetical protein